MAGGGSADGGGFCAGEGGFVIAGLFIFGWERGLTFWKASWSFCCSDILASGGERASMSVSESEASSSVWGSGCWVLYGRISYSPMSQMSMLPVTWEAVSTRWFWESYQYAPFQLA